MAIFNRENTSYIGRPAKVFDANGFEYHNCFECDTVTGRLVQQKTDEDGQLVYDEYTGEVVMVESYIPAPILVKFVNCKPLTKGPLNANNASQGEGR